MKQDQIKKLISEMSIDEKIGQLTQLSGDFYQTEDNVATGPMKAYNLTEEQIQQVGSVLSVVGAKRLIQLQEHNMKQQKHQIPQLYMADIINGYRTIFPIPLGLGCTFDPELIKEASELIAKESSRAGIHVTFSPMVDLVRDARWGRVMESTGEDPYLNSCFAKAIVEGYQGNNVLGKDRVGACIKHFAAYGAPMGGREYNQVELSERTLYEEYLPAYEAGVEAGAKLVMASFNTIAGIPVTGDQEILTEVLRKKMKFQGVVISDWGAIGELINHRVACSGESASKQAMNAGIDIDMMSCCYVKNLKHLLDDGSITMTQLDEAVNRVLQLKNELGLFENPYKDADPEYDSKPFIEDKNRNLARRVAAESFVLLKNDGILPLSKKPSEECSSIAFIGPYVDEDQICGAWSIFRRDSDTVNVKQGILAKSPELAVTFSKGCTVLAVDEKISGFKGLVHNELTQEESKKMLEHAIKEARTKDYVVMLMGEYYQYTGEGGSRTEITIPEHQIELFNKIYEVNPNIVVVLFSGRPLDIRSIQKKARGILQVWMPGTEGGNAIADVLFGDCIPCGKLSMCFPYNVGQVPISYSGLSTGRPLNESNRQDRFVSKYIDAPNEPLYPFGFGLSYVDFKYSAVKLSSNTLGKDNEITAVVNVTNTGLYKAKEIVQFYIQDKVSSVARPIKQLRGFQKIELLPNEEKKVEFTIREDMLRFYNKDMQYISEPGEFDVFIGTDSTTMNRATFKLV